MFHVDFDSDNDDEEHKHLNNGEQEIELNEGVVVLVEFGAKHANSKDEEGVLDEQHTHEAFV